MITDYASLQTEAADEAKRRDLASVMPALIQRAEAAISRELALYRLTSTVSGTTAGGIVPLPADVETIESITLDVNGRSHSLDYIPTMDGMQMTGCGVPRWYGVVPGAAQLFPPPSGDLSYSLRYAPKLVPLSDSNPTNWLLLNAPDVYLYRTCIQIGINTHEDALITRHTQFYNDAIQALRSQDARARLPRMGGLQIKPRGAR